jgi:hypothetical protein
LCRKSRSYCATEVTAGRAWWLRDDKGRDIGIQLRPPSPLVLEPEADENKNSIKSQPTITGRETQLNAEYYRGHFAPSAYRAYHKVRAWPHIFDPKAVCICAGKVMRPEVRA